MNIVNYIQLLGIPITFLCILLFCIELITLLTNFNLSTLKNLIIAYVLTVICLYIIGYIKPSQIIPLNFM